MVNISPTLDNFKTKATYLEVGKLKTTSLDLKKLSDVVKNEVVENAKFNTLKTKKIIYKLKFLVQLL